MKKNLKRKVKKIIEKFEDGHDHASMIFPKNFLWGTSTSAHQVEGDNTLNDWWQWEQRHSHVQSSGKATDHYNRYEEDFDIIQQLSNNAHRLSIEWSRIEPKEGEWNWEEVEHYRAVLKALKKRKIKTMVTLHHFTNPIWLVQRGGWLHKDAPQYFARYAEFVATQLGNLVDFWVTINEPMVYIVQSYVTGDWPPQHKKIWHGWRVFRRLTKAHNLAYKKIHLAVDKQHRKVRVGIAKNVVSLVTYSKTFFNYVYIRISEFLWNDLFFIFTKGNHDYIGINYYFHQRIRRDKKGRFLFVDVKQERREHSDLGWEIYAPGIFNVIMDFRKYKLPLYITENGIAAINDDKRIRFLIAHVKEVYHAIQAGADVRGYFHWSLLDNFEWDKGFTPRFGLVRVDYDTFKRTILASGKVYAEIAKENMVSHDHLRFLGHGERYEEL